MGVPVPLLMDHDDHVQASRERGWMPQRRDLQRDPPLFTPSRWRDARRHQVDLEDE